MKNEKAEVYRQQIKGRRVALVGTGISNRAAADFLLSCGAIVSARDQNPDPPAEVRDFFAARAIPFRFGADYLEALDEEIFYKTPGIRIDEPHLLRAAARGACITSEMEVFCALCPCPIFAVTGSDGKTTTTTLLFEMLKRAANREGRHVYVGGNIGTPLLPRLSEMTERDEVVLELSSFQLHTMRPRTAVAVVTNVSPNHLNWHLSMEEYIDSKKNIFRAQAPDARIVLNADNEITSAMASEAPSDVRRFSARTLLHTDGVCCPDGQTIFTVENGEAHELIRREELRLLGAHNVENFMAASAAAWGYADPEDIRAVAREFAGVRHRIELVCEKNGVRYFNNSIGTSPARTVAALNAFSEPLIVILGGYDKHLPDEPMLAPLAEKAKFAVFTGETGQRMRESLVRFGYPPEKTRYLASFDDAVRFAASLAVRGDTVLLSPAAASFDAFPNFEARGDRFCELINQLS